MALESVRVSVTGSEEGDIVSRKYALTDIGILP
jgi:hypothetical protein